MKYFFLKNKEMQKGQSLIEAVAAMAVVTIVLTALTIAVLLGLRNSEFTRKETIATQYSQQGMELLRNKRDTDWTTFNGYSGFMCLSGSTPISSCPVGGCTAAAPACTTVIGGSFIRDAQFSSSGCNGGKKVIVTTWWKDAKCSGGGYCKKARVVSCLFDTRAPTPV